MSNYVLSRLKQVFNFLINKESKVIVEYIDAIEQVERWLGDEESLVNYRNQILYWFLKDIFPLEQAVIQSKVLSIETWNEAVKKRNYAHKENKIPYYETSSNFEDPHIKDCQISTFILKQYNYKNHVTVKKNDIVLDCGACFGDTALWFRQEGAQKVYSFEPNPDTFSFLERNAFKYNEIDNPWLIPLPYAIGKEEGEISFKQEKEHPEACVIDEDGNIKVPIISLDLWCERNGVKPDFIKMDLEGYEPTALLGAKNIIQKYKPRVAICLYHNFSDMWTIPHILKSFCPQYTFWCKKSHLLYEFVLFGKVE